MDKKPGVFISYSHDSPEHANRVRALGASLSRDGCDCRLDVHKIADAGRSVAFADRCGDDFQRMGKRTTHADALHQAGKADESRRLFAEAKTMQAESQPAYPRLYSVPGFRYCDLLLSGAEHAAWQVAVDPDARIPNLESLEDACGQVAERATQTLEWAERHEFLLDIALDHLTLGRAALYRALLTANRAMRSSDSDVSDTAIQVPQSAIAHLAAAVDGFRQSGNMTYLPRGLLTRAWQRQLTGDPSGAALDLNEAAEIAERGPMPLHQADILLTRARLFGPRHDAGEYPWCSPRDDLAEARSLIEQHGYHRRDQELADAEAALRRRHGS